LRYGVIAETLLERAFLASGLAPTAMVEGYGPAYARVITLATELGMFDALAAGGLSAEAVASACRTDVPATEKVLNLLVTMRYLSFRDGTYRVKRHVRRWLLSNAPGSVRDAVLMKRLEWRWIEELDSFVRNGRPLDVHGTMTREDWGAYQRGMRAQANLIAPLLARQIPVPAGAREMLDIGGSHGYFSVVLCRRHPGLRATVLELPSAVEHAAPLLAREEMGDRVVLEAGDVLTDDLGESTYDLILMFSLAHHFDDATNRALVTKSARALRPGGTLVIGEALRPASPGKGGQMGAFFDLYFALTSESGTWAFDEMSSWQRDAGLVPRKPIRLRFAPGIGLQVADRGSS
jgi:predicted O-methyltransferase YrrM